MLSKTLTKHIYGDVDRSLGGLSSDIAFKYVGFRGRIWMQFLSLFFEAVFLFCFGLVDNSQPWYVALAVLVFFSLFEALAAKESFPYSLVFFLHFSPRSPSQKILKGLAKVQMAEGTSYAIVPFMNKQQLAVVSALVGAGGNLGAVIAGFGFYHPINDPWALRSSGDFLSFWPYYLRPFGDVFFFN